jgi:hypothetical protein
VRRYVLDAFVKKNVRRILLTRTAEHQNDKNEDAITSMVFTPLRFMSAENALSCFQLIFPELDKLTCGERAESAKIELWPSLKHLKRRVEPDLLAKFRFSRREPLTLVGEMKWDSEPTPEQVQRETGAAGDGAYIFVIVKKRRGHTKDSLGCNRVLTWTEVHSQIFEARKRFPNNSPVFIWTTLVSDFLSRAEQLIFTGFGSLPTVPERDEGPIFFRKQQPSRRYEWTHPFHAVDEAVVFFDVGKSR